MPEGDLALSCSGLVKRYGAVVAVDGLDLEVRRGECFGLLGPNGAGKTTTLRLLLGLIQPDGGELSLLGEPVPERAREARVKIGVVPQMDNLDPDFTVAENLLVYGRYFGMKESEIVGPSHFSRRQHLRISIAGLRSVVVFAGLKEHAEFAVGGGEVGGRLAAVVERLVQRGVQLPRLHLHVLVRTR